MLKVQPQRRKIRWMRRGIQWWVLGSGVLMLIGAFGPWVTVLGSSVGGTDGSNDGWLVVAAAAIGGGLFYAMRRSRAAGVWALLGGLAGLAVTAYDRGNLQNAIRRGGAFERAIAQVGWGLNLALIASISMAIAGVVAIIKARSAAAAAPSSAPPVPSSPQPTTAPPESPDTALPEQSTTVPPASTNPPSEPPPEPPTPAPDSADSDRAR